METRAERELPMRRMNTAPRRRIWPFPLLVFLAIALHVTLAPAVSAFQSFEEFTRSKNKLYNIEAKAIAEPVQARRGESFVLHLWVDVSPGWHIYSLEEQGDDATLATKIYFKENRFQGDQPWKEPEPTIALDGALDKVVKIHRNSVQFIQKQQIPESLTPGTYSISGKIVFRACDNRICSLPRETAFQTQVQVTAK